MDKQAIREQVWDDLEASGTARFPFPPHGRIPNFAGADTAADRLTATTAWQEATAIKANPDAPQLPVRRRALRSRKTVYMAVPRLAEEAPFLRLDPAVIDDINHATTIGGSAEVGEPVVPEDVEEIDLVVSGSVAVSESGHRVGKGEGYSDLEFGLLSEYGAVTGDTTTATTVHERQVQTVDTTVPQSPVDVPMDLVVTPDRTIESGPHDKPQGIDWDLLPDGVEDDIPVLDQL